MNKIKWQCRPIHDELNNIIKTYEVVVSLNTIHYNYTLSPLDLKTINQDKSFFYYILRNLRTTLLNKCFVLT